MQILRHTVPALAAGTSHTLTQFNFGADDAKQKVVLQAALHADEQPGMMVLHELIPLLEAAEKAGELNARFVLFPMVNPIGMADLAFQQHQGRYDRYSGKNFNRDWPDFVPILTDDIAAQLGQDGQENRKILQQAMRKWLREQQASNGLAKQRALVVQTCIDADVVLDLHCDNIALPHLFVAPHQGDWNQSLADWVGAAATLLAEDSGGGSFDEVWSRPWAVWQRRFPDIPLPTSYSATIEYRGTGDVSESLNQEDAQRLFGFFQSQGWVSGLDAVERFDLKVQAARSPTDLNATEMLRVEQSGLLKYRVSLGDWVEPGDIIADLVLLEGGEAFQAQVPVACEQSGQVISLNHYKYVWPGRSIAKIVGETALSSRGDYLLED